MQTIKQIKKLSYRITLESGLHIGASKEGLKIGGIDSSVVKNPINDMPYIPGSSIKGRMRSLLEMKYGDFKKSGNKLSPTEDITHNSNIARAFGCAGDIKLASRIIVSDFQLSDADDIVGKSSMNIFTNDKSDFFEAKAENSVPRFLTGNANPRIQERVPAGVSFDGTITLIEDDMPQTKISIEQLEKILSEGIEMITMTYLGGGGSRGNGKVSFILLGTE